MSCIGRRRNRRMLHSKLGSWSTRPGRRTVRWIGPATSWSSDQPARSTPGLNGRPPGSLPGTRPGRARLAASRSISSLASTVCDVIDQRGPRAPTRQRAERSIRRSSGGFDDAVRASIKVRLCGRDLSPPRAPLRGAAAHQCGLATQVVSGRRAEVGMGGASDNGLDEPDRRGAAFRSGYVTAECHGATALRPGRGG